MNPLFDPAGKIRPLHHYLFLAVSWGILIVLPWIVGLVTVARWVLR